MRKHAASKENLKKFWEDVSTRFFDPDVLASIGVLLFQSIRGVKWGVDSRMKEIYLPLLDIDNPVVDLIIKSGNDLLFDQINRRNSAEVLEIFLECKISKRKIEVLENFVRYKGGGDKFFLTRFFFNRNHTVFTATLFCLTNSFVP